jgi:hypothetical protein
VRGWTRSGWPRRNGSLSICGKIIPTSLARSRMRRRSSF